LAVATLEGTNFICISSKAGFFGSSSYHIPSITSPRNGIFIFSAGFAAFAQTAPIITAGIVFKKLLLSISFPFLAYADYA